MAVNDISRAELDAPRAGGEVMRPGTHVPGVGMLSVVSDSAGALIGLFQPELGHSLTRVH